jgi:hypothetical protein
MIDATETAYRLLEEREDTLPFEALEPTTWQLALYYAAIAAFKLESGEGVYPASMQEEEDPTDAIIPPRWEEFTRYKSFAGHTFSAQLDRLQEAEAAIRDLILGVDKWYQRPDARKVEAYSEQCLIPCFDAVYALACLLLERGYVSAMELWAIAMPEAFAQRTSSALHEAGHAVVHHVNGDTPVYVSIVPDRDYLGCCVIDPDPDAMELTVADKVAALLAGPLSECMGSDGTLSQDSHHSDTGQIGRIFDEHSFAGPERDTALLSAMNSAKALLSHHWNSVQELAQELLRRHWMAGDELSEFLRTRIVSELQET